MAGSDTEIIVQLTAETEELQAGLDAGAAAVTDATQAMAAAMAEAAAASSAAAVKIGESAEAAALRIKAMVAASLEQQAVNGGVAESERSVAERMGQRLEMTGAQVEAMQASIAAQDAQMESMTGIVGAETEVAAATAAATVAITENSAAMVINGGVARELGVLMGEGLRGNFARMEGSVITLGNRMGLMQSLFSPIGAIVAGATVSILAFGIAAVKGAEEQDKFNKAILMTGGAAGASSAAVQSMANSIGQSSGSFANANEAMLSIVRSGKVAADQLQMVGKAAVDMSRLTGESVDKSVEDFVKLQEKPVQAVVALNDKYHFLTAAVFDQIEALQKQGDTQEAAKVATAAYSDALEKRIKESELQLNVFGRAWRALGADASWAWNAMSNIGNSDGPDRKISDLTQKINIAEAALKVFKNTSVSGEFLDSKTQEIERLKGELAPLIEMQKKASDSAAVIAKKSESDKHTIDEVAAQDKFNNSLKDTSHLMEAIAEAKKRAEDIHKNDAGSDSIKGINFDSAGAVAGGEQWNATVKKLTKEYGENLTGAIRAARAAAKKSAEEAMNALEMQRSGTASNTAERIQADAAILASATRLYGANSSQQKSALSQMLSDEKAYDAAVIKARDEANKAIMDQTVQSASDNLRMQQESIQTQFALHNESKQQELAQLAAANDAEYQAALTAMQNYENTLDKRVKAYADMVKKIEKLQDDHRLASKKSDDDIQKAALASWEKGLAPINSAFSQSIQGMIQGTQTFKKGLDNILSSIVASYAQKGIETVINWIAVEAAKTSASTAGAANRSIVDADAAAESKAIDAATGKSQITTAAATGAAKAYQAIVGIPYVGPILAPIAAGVAFAGIEAFGGMISSAAGGWERVPADGMMTELHKDEMVLPAHLAQGVRDMTSGNSGGGGQGGGDTHHWNIQTMDGRSTERFFRNNMDALAKAVKTKTQNSAQVRR